MSLCEEPKTTSGEHQYLLYMEKIMEQPERITRNSNTVKSLFNVNLVFNNIATAFPLLTTKKMYWKGICEELFWFINGSTDAKILAATGVHIWDANSSRSELDKLGHINREEGDCGPIYGFQWRHFGATYIDCHTDYTGQGFDQLQNCIDILKKDPYSRRCLMTGLNPSVYDDVVLPPCHVTYQFYVSDTDVTEKHILNCFMYQRSGDMFLGVPFNIASTALLTSIIANHVGMMPGSIAITIVDAHIYSDHYDAVEEQLKRVPYELPTLTIATDDSITNSVNNINNYTSKDLILSNYKCYSAIKAPMST